MVAMPEEWRPVLDALIQAPIAWQSPAAIAETLGASLDETSDLLSLIDTAGWLSVWEVDEGPLVTLSALAAERLQVVLIEVGPDETPRWSPAGDPPPPQPRARFVCRSEKSARLDGIADPHPSPDLAAERSERLSARTAAFSSRRVPPCRVEDLPWPSLLLGQGLTPWPGPGAVAAGFATTPCPACGGHTLRPHVYCLCCDRWGLDTWLAALTPATRSSSPRPCPSLPQSFPGHIADRQRLQKQLQSDRARRKARRKARRLSRGA